MALQAHDALFNHMCSSEDIQLAFCELARCRAVCRTWHEAVQKFLPTLHVLDFHGHEASVAGTDVLRSIALVAGITLHTLDLRGCRRLTCADFQEILPVLRVSCRSVTTLDVTGCQDEVQFDQTQGARMKYSLIKDGSSMLLPSAHGCIFAAPRHVRCLNTSRRALPTAPGLIFARSCCRV